MALPNNPTQLEVIKEVKRLEAEKYDATNPNGYTNNNGTVTSVGAGAGLSISGTASVNPTVNVDSDHKLLSNDEYALLATKRFVLDELDDLPTVNNKTITIQKNGTTVKSFTLNQSSDETINFQLAKTDVGLGNVDNVQQYSASNPPPYPVSSVNGKTGAVTGLATSNPNLLINSNFAINQRDGYFASIDTVVYENADGTNPIGRVATAIQTTIVSATIRRATNVSVKGVSSYKYRETFASAPKLKLTYNIYGNELTTPDLYGVSGTTETKIGASSYTYDRVYNRITISDSGVLEAYNTFAVYYALDTNAQTISGTLYFKTSDCTSGYTGGRYSVDRFYLVGNSATLTPTANGITIVSGGSWQGINQEIEDYSKLKGQTLVLSIKTAITDGNGTFVMGIRDNNGVILESFKTATTTKSIFTAQTTIPNDWSGTRLYVFVWSRYASQTIEIDWVKLEVGDVATEYTPPLIAEELPKCQRYYQIVRTKGGSANIFGFGALRSARNARIEIPTVSTLRVAPTVSTHNIALLNLPTSGIVQSGITITLLSITNNNIFLQSITTSDIGTTGANVQLYGLSAESYIAFDAEL